LVIPQKHYYSLSNETPIAGGKKSKIQRQLENHLPVRGKGGTGSFNERLLLQMQTICVQRKVDKRRGGPRKKVRGEGQVTAQHGKPVSW